VREGSPKVTITTLPSYAAQLPDTPYALWVRGELDDLLHLPPGARVEIIAGDVIVTPAPPVTYGRFIRQITQAFLRESLKATSFPWDVREMASLDLSKIAHGYVPDLIVAEKNVFQAAREAGRPALPADEIEMVVEVASRSAAARYRPPAERSVRRTTKWWGCASVEIPYYLLIDPSPGAARATLYSIPNGSAGAYLHSETWEFGEAVHLPDPFGVDISTGRWKVLFDTLP
jgi:hypothetical protein